MPTKYDALVERFLVAEPIHRMAARMILLALQEDAVEALEDAYYAGVTDKQGIAILELLGEIGGYEALHMMRDIVKHETKRRSLRVVAAKGLMRNADNLSKKERKVIERFLSKYAPKEE
ncbi:MAG: hypothetical protein AAF846_03925 [Chloroflexota bacterium]